MKHDEQWAETLDLLDRYVVAHGHAPGSTEVFEGVMLGNWLRVQRELTRDHRLLFARMDALRALGVDLSVPASHRPFGDCPLPHPMSVPAMRGEAQARLDRQRQWSGFGIWGVVTRTDDAVLCHECGRELKSLVQHLRSAHEMSTDDYRATHGLPATVPLTCLSTSAKMSAASSARVGTPQWTRFEQRRDATQAASLAAAAEAARHPAPGTTMARVETATMRFIGQEAGRDETRWGERLAQVLAHRAVTGRWPSHADPDPEARRLGQWLSHQRRALRRGRLTDARRGRLQRAGIDLMPARGRRVKPTDIRA